MTEATSTILGDPAPDDLVIDETLPLSEEDWKKFRASTTQALPDQLKGKSIPDILLKHQKDILVSTSKYSITATDKSRRIGATWGVCADAVLVSGAAKSAGGMDTLYIGYNLDMTREFIDTCAMWAKAFMPACTEVGEFLFVDKGETGDPYRQIQAFRIRFASGFEIVALSSRPRSLRGRQGYIILDEFAFHDDPEGLLKAACAFLIWGGKILVISTHNGVDNDFAKLIEDIRKGEYGDDANVVRCTFDDALVNGLFKRICLIKGTEWSIEAEARWRSNIRKTYRHNAAEELDCIPAQGSGVYLTRPLIEACTFDPDTVETLICPPGFELKEENVREAYVQAWLDQNVKPHIEKLDKKLTHHFGQDFARSGDASIFVPIAVEQRLTRRVPFVVEMRNVPYEQQKQIAIWITQQLPRFGGGIVDSGGNGGYLGEVMVQKFGALLIQALQLSQAWYAEFMPKMKDGFEGRKLLIPANDNCVNDLRQIKLVRGIPMVPQGALVEGTDGLQRHGDFAVALCLANAASLAPVAEYAYQGSGSRKSGKRGDPNWQHPDDRRQARGTRFSGKGAW